MSKVDGSNMEEELSDREEPEERKEPEGNYIQFNNSDIDNDDNTDGYDDDVPEKEVEGRTGPPIPWNFHEEERKRERGLVGVEGITMNKLLVIGLSAVMAIGGIMNPLGGIGSGMITLITGSIIYFRAGRVYAAPTIAILGYEFYAYSSGYKLASILAFVFSIVYFAVCLIYFSDNKDKKGVARKLSPSTPLRRLEETRLRANDDEGAVHRSKTFSAERARIVQEQRKAEEIAFNKSISNMRKRGEL